MRNKMGKVEQNNGKRVGKAEIAPPLYDDPNLAIEKWLELDKKKKPVAYNPHEEKNEKRIRKHNFKKIKKRDLKKMSKAERKRYKRAKKRRYRVRRTIGKLFLAIILLLLIAVGFAFSFAWGLLSNVNTIDIGDDLFLDHLQYQ